MEEMDEPGGTEFDLERIYRELLPCPFCGGSPREEVWFMTKAESDHWEIKCAGCGCRMRHDRADKVIGFWNTRFQSSPPQ